MNKIEEYMHLRKIYDYWKQNPFNYDRFKPKEATPEEYYSFALADTLSRYSKAQDNSEPSKYRLSIDGIDNWKRFFNRILKDGYLQNANACEVLNSYTVQELKIIADSIGIKKTGKKTDIIQRIYENMSTDELNKMINHEKLYIISEKGKQYIQANQDYVLLSKHMGCGVTLSEFNKHRILCGRKRNFYDTIFQALTEKRFQCHLKHYWNDLWSTDLSLFNIMKAESEQTSHNVPLDSALLYYVESLYLDTCQIQSINAAVNGICPGNYDNNILPRISERDFSFRKYLPVNYAELYNMLPPSLFDTKEFEAYIDDIFNPEANNYELWNKRLQNRLKAFYKKFAKRR